ncbi:hypothetical protein BJ875DRAFT_453044 [Amylocarpus encephaloides]|uniref:NADH dehydrogenase [ubiquinone] 1 alpha subcomplex assembly factor 3 n=1 Tax=Amylocarpus encephaloides TaxID=45428 RepID=A0A9P8C8T3_9HELO|nr:hypothetical protein BJ875DRAFT_453044 [Amylocarpus encephaloides]
MPPLRPSIARPTIHDLKTFLFSPQPLARPRYCLSLSLSLSQSQPRTPSPSPSHRPFHSRTSVFSSRPPKSHDRGPPSKEDTQTDFGSMNVLGNTPAPSTSIDACAWDGFHLNNGVKVTGGKGVLLVNGEAFEWCPWLADVEGKTMVNGKGQWDVGDEAWGVLGLMWPKPDLLILGLGKEMRPISPRVRLYVNSLGIRVDIQDTRNAAAQFNLLATERGLSNVAAALVPLGWREGKGCV